MNERRGRRWADAVQRFNRNPRLVGFARRTRERTLGDDDHIDHLSTARGRPSDLAARQLVELRGDEPGFAGELGLNVPPVWPMPPGAAKKRRFSAKGTPPRMAAYAVSRS